MFLILTLGTLSILLALILTPIVRDRFGKFGFLDHPDGVRKKHATAVPRVGGIAIVLAYVATFAIAFALPFSYTYVLHRALPNILHLALAGSVIFVTGVLDDRLRLSAWKKLGGNRRRRRAGLCRRNSRGYSHSPQPSRVARIGLCANCGLAHRLHATRSISSTAWMGWRPAWAWWRRSRC